MLNYSGSTSLLLQPTFANVIKNKPSIISKVSFKDINNIISSAQKMINIYDRAIPIINQTKPMIDNIRTTLKVAKVFKGMNSSNNLEKAFDNLPDYDGQETLKTKKEEEVIKVNNNPFIPML